MSRKGSIFLIVLATLGAGWMGVAAYRSLTPSADSTHVQSGLAEENPPQLAETNDASDDPLESGPMAKSTSTDDGSARSPSPDLEPDDPPKPQAGSLRYQKKMRLGAKRATFLLDTPLEWLQQYLQSVTTVESLVVHPSALTPEAIDLIAESGNVEQMEIGAVHLLSDEGATALAHLTGVESISIGTNRPYSSNSGPVEEALNPFIEQFFSIPDLKSLSIAGTINDELLRRISELGHLVSLRLDNNNDLRRYDKITTAGLMHLGRLSGLEELVMINFTVGRHRIELNRLVDVFSGLSNLRRLSLSGWTVTDKNLTPILPILSRLSYLNLNNTNITDAFYKKIDSTWMLEELSAPGIGDAGVKAVASVPDLRRLGVGERVTDAGIKWLAENTAGLEALRIGGAPVTDAALNALQRCRSLKELGVRDNPNITPNGLKQLCEVLQIEVLDTSINKFITRIFLEDLLSVTPSLKTLIHYPYSTLTNGDRQKLMNDYPHVAIHPKSPESQWFR